MAEERGRPEEHLGLRFLLTALPPLVGLFVIIWLFSRLQPGPAFHNAWESIGHLTAAVIIAGMAVVITRYALQPMVALFGAGSAASSPAPAASVAQDEDAVTRARLAQWVLPVGMAAISVLSIVLVIVFVRLARDPNLEVQGKIDSLLMGLFTAVLPVFATWVGTVLAFYFSNESFRVAAQAAREAHAGPPAAPERVTAGGRMIPYDKIAKLVVKDEADALKLKIEEVARLFNDAVTRCVIFDDKREALFIIRCRPPNMPKDWLDAAKAGTATQTVDDYLKLGDNAKDARNFQVVAATTTVEAARAALQREKTRDLFVSETGAKTPVMGWCTDDTLR